MIRCRYSATFARHTLRRSCCLMRCRALDATQVRVRACYSEGAKICWYVHARAIARYAAERYLLFVDITLRQRAAADDAICHSVWYAKMAYRSRWWHGYDTPYCAITPRAAIFSRLFRIFYWRYFAIYCLRFPSDDTFHLLFFLIFVIFAADFRRFHFFRCLLLYWYFAIIFIDAIWCRHFRQPFSLFHFLSPPPSPLCCWLITLPLLIAFDAAPPFSSLPLCHAALIIFRLIFSLDAAFSFLYAYYFHYADAFFLPPPAITLSAFDFAWYFLMVAITLCHARLLIIDSPMIFAFMFSFHAAMRAHAADAYDDFLLRCRFMLIDAFFYDFLLMPFDSAFAAAFRFFACRHKMPAISLHFITLSLRRCRLFSLLMLMPLFQRCHFHASALFSFHYFYLLPLFTLFHAADAAIYLPLLRYWHYYAGWYFLHYASVIFYFRYCLFDIFFAIFLISRCFIIIIAHYFAAFAYCHFAIISFDYFAFFLDLFTPLIAFIFCFSPSFSSPLDSPSSSISSICFMLLPLMLLFWCIFSFMLYFVILITLMPLSLLDAAMPRCHAAILRADFFFFFFCCFIDMPLSPAL